MKYKQNIKPSVCNLIKGLHWYNFSAKIELLDFNYFIVKEYEKKNNFRNLFNFVYLLINQNIKFDFEKKDLLLQYYKDRAYKFLYKEMKENLFREYQNRFWKLRDITKIMGSTRNIVEIEILVDKNDVGKRINILNNIPIHINKEINQLNENADL